MPTLALSSFPAEERARVEQVLSHAQLSAADVMITKAVFSSTRMPGRIREMVTFVHGPLSRTYPCSDDGQWVDKFALDLALDTLRRARSRTPATARQGGDPPLLDLGRPNATAKARAVAVPRGKSTRLLAGGEVRKDDAQVLEAVKALPASPQPDACLFRAVILNEAGRPYREVDLHGLLASVSLTASLNAQGFKLDPVKRDGRSRRYDWRFFKAA